ncbi:intraflagellar transport protein 22 homolog [Lepeophtheirus salmonis]|nr:intraflagellar transport protein 22 homolog [Lepeophtheirus salmonis]XP_040565612.1 intraflagellar transport protein 22 homolog [Lepeophtheirus salmonis]
MYKLKIIFVGPEEGGKSVIANFLSDTTESSQGEYRPTKVVRILEFECQKLQILNNNNANSGRFVKTDIELWDISGNTDYESSWPALCQVVHGIVFVYNPNKGSNQIKMLELFHKQFKTIQTDSQCLVLTLSNKNDNLSMKNRGFKLPSQFNRITQSDVNLNEEGNKFRTEFNSFLSELLNNITDKRDQEEINIMNIKS